MPVRPLESFPRESELFSGGALECCIGLLLLAYVAQNYFVKTSDVLSWTIVLPVWVFIGLLAIRSITNKYVFLGSIIWAILLSIYALASYLDPLNGFTEISFFVLLGILFAFSISCGVSSGYLHGPHKFERLNRLISVLISCAVVYWIYSLRQEQRYSANVTWALSANNYLIIADLLVLYSILQIAPSRTTKNVFWAAMTFTGLVLLGSRASLVFGCVAILMRFLEVTSWRQTLRVILLGLTSAGVVALVLSMFSGEELSRTAALGSFTNDKSFIVRDSLFTEWASLIRSNPGCLLKPCLPEPGEYVHNAISALQYFGIVGGLVFSFFGILVIFAVILGWRPGTLSLLVFCLLQAIFARSFGSVVYPLLYAFGIVAMKWLVGRPGRSLKPRDTPAGLT